MKLQKIYLILSIAIVSVFTGCSGLLEPDPDFHLNSDRIVEDPAFAEGLLLNAYQKLPANNNGSNNGYSFSDVATDDAVSNDKTNGYRLMATGQWSALNNPMSSWNNMLEGVMYLNLLLPEIDKINWYWKNPTINTMFKARIKGESLALRAMLKYHLLQAHAGKSTSGELLGIPLYNEFMDPTTNFNLPRATFAQSVESITADLDTAMKYLPMNYVNIPTTPTVPVATEKAKMVDMFNTTVPADYNQVYGVVNVQRVTKRIIMAYKARLALLAASKAFNPDAQAANDPKWIEAANSAANVLATISGITGLDANGHKFYEAARVDAATATNDSKEILWRSSIVTNFSLEKNLLPPGLNGNGMVNPTQNLVDAFPMSNGQPISVSPTYNPANPYAGRDPRLAAYIVFNGSSLQSKTIKTGFGGGFNAVDSIETSTRTGYYVRKLIREDVTIPNTGIATSKKHFMVHIRYTEMFLNYAEAANEAWGPTGVGTVASYSSKDVIAAIRKRGGLPATDTYLAGITTKEAMRDLIRNERRIELCFEGFRFWDIRRWGLEMTETAKGIYHNGTTYVSLPEVEQRLYQPYMQYGPISEREVLKYPALIQNAGW